MTGPGPSPADQPAPHRREDQTGGPFLLTPLRQVRAIRAQVAEGLERLEVRTVADLIRHLPMRYERIEAESPIASLQEGTIVSARGEIAATKIAGGRFAGRGRSRFQAVLVDETGRLDLVWFNQPWMQKKIVPGQRVRVQGLAKRYGVGLQISNPTLLPTEDADDAPPGERAPGDGRRAVGPRIRPVYPASEGVSSLQIELAVGAVLERALREIDDHLPPEFRRQKEVLELREAYRLIHEPATLEEAAEARRRLAYDELLMLQLAVFMRREQVRRSSVAPALKWSRAIDGHIRARLPFTLTPSQDQVINEIVRDLEKTEPANRLIQGDVGSGKTVVALYAMLLAAADNKQAALMAPTELLAEQHHASIAATLKGSNIRVRLLTGSVTGAERRDILASVAEGTTDILIGTHALLSESVEFRSLAVVVIDEQHRFGVHQRAALRSKASEDPHGRAVSPHVLVMTATPIPRTLALTLFGDLDVSTIRGMPPGRTPIITKVVPPSASADVYSWVRTRIDAGEQAYVVVPAIDTGASAVASGDRSGDAELNDLRSVQHRLETNELKGKRIAALHGRLSPATRDTVMGRFRAGLIDCLVATTVIEVGVDVPNATVMVVEHADQFGLAQLHQLRGRIGRGSKRSVCVLFADPNPATPDAAARIGVMARTSDGFELAEKDLEIRGPGEVFGLRQAGAPPLVVADLMNDRELLAMARRDAAAWIARSPELRGSGEELLRKRLLKLHGQWLGLGDVA